ncbi:hypothetical protein ASPWEDRAFT_46154 [Aspergillus wentii DTO 134E9]|uniref:Uncharacterized protein n=1 Tax=Aspergillus wentii DTO 134E9 TaxID=1073089 RepID=A0A1L9R6K3_ASPWE|nr:uncharacterized protein ASPWEDRAFT_46154 [Aspergillus wentii DTO 134E9]OJJ30552.1 hypothetical protein ASPWEDRAFT_46154 [Aspergillus wentii DTO 134E9]
MLGPPERMVEFIHYNYLLPKSISQVYTIYFPLNMKAVSLFAVLMPIFPMALGAPSCDLTGVNGCHNPYNNCIQKCYCEYNNCWATTPGNTCYEKLNQCVQPCWERYNDCWQKLIDRH